MDDSNKSIENINSEFLKYLIDQAVRDSQSASSYARKANTLVIEQGEKINSLLEGQKEFKETYQTLGDRITDVEYKTETHEKTLVTLIEEQKVLNDNLSSIQKIMTQIKWAAYGALGMFALDTIGISELIKSFIGG